MTRFIIHDTIKLLKPLYLSTEHPKVRFQQVSEVLFAEDSFVQPLQKARMTGSGGFGAGAQQAAGYFTMAQQGWGLFNPTRRVEASAWVFERFEELDILARIERQLQSLLAAYPATPVPDELHVTLFPSDPANAGVMRMEYGFAIFGGTPGWLVMQMWPDAGNLARLDAMLAYGYAWQMRQHALAGKALYTLADHLVMEGLAAAFIADCVTDLHVPAWAVTVAPPDHWDATLDQVAAMYGLKGYDDMIVNVYGHMIPVGPERPPVPEPLDAEELAYAAAIMREALAETNPVRIAAYLYGDEIIAAKGHAAAGLSPFSGFYVGAQLINAYREVAGDDLMLAFITPTSDILKTSGVFELLCNPAS